MDRQELINKGLNLLNIIPEYYDALGEHYILEDKDALKFLSIFGIKKKTLEEDIEALENSFWSQPLEPIYVIRKHKSENRIYFYEKADFNYDNAELTISKQEYPIAWPGKSAEYKDINGKIYNRHYFNIPELEIGYHNLELKLNGTKYRSLLVVAPDTAYLPENITKDNTKGLACHLYSAYSHGSQGIGDFSDLKLIAEKTKKAGGEILMTQPWHYTSIVKNDNRSPYYPLSRMFLNPLYIDLRSLNIQYPDYMNFGKYVDYDNVLKIKIPLLKKYFKNHKNDKEFIEFKKDDKLLDKFACFCVLYEINGKISWKDWDKKLQNPNSQEIKNFEKENSEEIDFHKFLQYLTDKQQREAFDKTQELNMKIGICNDLAVGSCHHSFEAWYYGKKILVQDASVGAPPDEMEERGQDWGITPYNHLEMRKTQYEFYREVISRSMKNAGAIRLDHALHVLRLFWNIDKRDNKNIGSYVYMNMDEILGIIALESHLHKCIIIAEDLGTVADGFRERLHEEKILTTKELYFELDENGFFKKPEEYERFSISTIHTHDTATIEGYLNFTDLNYQLKIGIIDNDTYTELRGKREKSIEEIMKRYQIEDRRFLKEVFNKMLFDNNSCISLAYIDDMTDEKEQLNLPGTTIEHRNWSHKLSKPIEEIEIEF